MGLPYQITIPPQALEAGARAVEARINQPGQCSYHDMARAAFEAMVAAWPGMWNEQDNGSKVLFDETPNLILPLTEKQDE